MVKQSSVGAKASFNGLQGLAASALVLVLTGCVSGGSSGTATDPSAVPGISDADRVLWLTLNEENSAPIADSSSYRHTVVGSAETSSDVGIAGNARRFANDPNDEANSYIKVADANTLDLTDALSIEAWVKPTESGQSSFIVAKNQGWNVNMAYALALHEGAIEVLLADNAYQTDYVLPVDEWTHVATTWDGSVLRVFANGIQIHRKNNVTDVIVANEQPVLIGARNRQATVSETKSFTGTIDEVSVYRVALLPSQVCVEAGRTWESGTCSGGAFGGATPVATSSTYAIDADAALTSQLAATDTDTDSTALIYTLGEIGSKGHIAITNPTTGAFTYTPNPMAEGEDQFTFYATDGVNRSEAATVTINMTRTNVDTDGDGMFDHIERTYGLNSNDPADAATDLDGDGVSNLDEIIAGTDPTISNTPDASRALAFGFSEGTGLSAFDHSGNGNNATLDRPQWVVGPTGSALEFHGADALTVVDADSLDITSALTISAWINPDVEDQVGYILAKNYGWDDQMAYALTIRDGKLRVVLNNTLVTSTATVPTGEWSHVTATWDGTTVKFYVDGTLAAAASYTGTLLPNAERLIIGGRNRLGTGRSELFTGSIDQLQIWNAALTESQVCANYGGVLDSATCVK